MSTQKHSPRRPSFVCGLLLAVLAVSAIHADERDAPVTDIRAGNEPVAVRSWLVAGPFASPERHGLSLGEGRREGYETDYLESIGGEEDARPRIGTEIPESRGSVKVFFAYEWGDDYLDLTQLFGQPENVTAYLSATLDSDQERRVYVHLGANDCVKAWIGGRLVFSSPEDGLAYRSEHIIPLDLPRGRTPVLLKIGQAGRGWGAFFEVCTQEAHMRLLTSGMRERALAGGAAYELSQVRVFLNGQEYRRSMVRAVDTDELSSSDGRPVVSLPDGDEPLILDTWLVAGPFMSASLPHPAADGPQRSGYATDYLTALGGERGARPQAGTTVERADLGGQVTFTPYRWTGEYTDLTQVFGPARAVCAYLFCEIESPREQTVFLHAGANDAFKLWIGGDVVTERATDGIARESDQIVRVQLSRGKNRVLVKLDQAGAGWGAYLSLYSQAAQRQYVESFQRSAVGSYEWRQR